MIYHYLAVNFSNSNKILFDKELEKTGCLIWGFIYMELPIWLVMLGIKFFYRAGNKFEAPIRSKIQCKVKQTDFISFDRGFIEFLVNNLPFPNVYPFKIVGLFF